MSFQSKAKAHTLTFRCALVIECTEAKNVQNLHRSRINPANWPIRTLTSTASSRETGRVPQQHESSARFLLCRGQGEKSRMQRTVPSRGKNLQAASCQHAALPTTGWRLACCVESLNSCIWAPTLWALGCAGPALLSPFQWQQCLLTRSANWPLGS